MSADITLPIAQKPQWPPMCILCGHPHPDATFRFRAERIGWSQFLTLSWAIGSRPLVEAPACKSCARRLKRRRVARGFCSVLLILPFIVLSIWLGEKLGLTTGSLKPFRKLIVLGMALALYAPFFVWELLHPPLFDATARGDKLDYEFQDAEYAKLFEQENRATAF
jgi:hypothetical protein